MATPARRHGSRVRHVQTLGRTGRGDGVEGCRRWMSGGNNDSPPVLGGVSGQLAAAPL